MRVLVLGATGRTGRHLPRLLTAAGHDVVLYGRRLPEGASGVIGALDDPVALDRALEGADAVIAALGSGLRNPACLTFTRTLLGVAPEGLRHVTVSGATIEWPGDRRTLADRIGGALLRTLARSMIAERQQEADLLRGAPLRVTLLRPPRLRNGRRRGRFAFAFDRPETAQIDRADLAAAAVAALARDDLEGRAPFVSWPRA